MTDSGDNTNVYHGIESCRPGSDDLQLPEMSHVANAIAADPALEECYHDVQEWDTNVAAAFRDVPAPEGLQERLLAALAEQRLDVDEKPEPPAKTVSRRDDSSRRLWIGGALAASLLIALGVSATVWNWSTPVAVETWVATVTELHGSLPDAWKTAEAAPSDRPSFARLQRDVSVLGWMPIKSKFDSSAVAYRLEHPRGATATLFVFRPAAIDPNLPLAPPAEPSQRNSRLTTGVWTSDGLVYALVVDGGREQYQGFLRSNSVAALLRWLPLA